MKTVDKLEVIEEMLGSLPEAPEGKKLVGVKFKKPKLGEKFLCNENKWVTAVSNWQTFGQVAIFQDKPKKVKRTTLQDLVGEDGQKNFYTIERIGEVVQAYAELDSRGELRIGGHLLYDRDYFSPETRWSHSPFTPYKEANKFVV